MNGARIYKRLFPFDSGRIDLDGSDKDTGLIGFGAPPPWVGTPRAAPPQVPTRATAWRPIITSIGYSTLGDETPHEVRFQFQEKIIEDAQFESGTTITGAMWLQVVFERTGINFVYITGIPVPVSEQTGSPFELKITTKGRQDPTLAVVDWEWARFNLDITEGLLRELQAAPTPVFDVTDRQAVGT